MPQALEEKPELDVYILPFINIFNRLHNTRREKFRSIEISEFVAYCSVIGEHDLKFLDEVISLADMLYLRAIKKVDEDRVELEKTFKTVVNKG